MTVAKRGKEITRWRRKGGERENGARAFYKKRKEGRPRLLYKKKSKGGGEDSLLRREKGGKRKKEYMEFTIPARREKRIARKKKGRGKRV